MFIALHAGAGYHNPAHHVDLQELFHAACQVALTQAGSTEEAVYLAIQLLEASPLTNAGRGSVLTEDGRVECEASIMLGNGAYSGVGAVCGVEHPIQLAYQMVKERNEYGLIKELGRVRPILLVGDGAWKYAEEKGFARVGPQEWYDHHVTEETRRKWKKFRDIIDKHKQKQAKAREDIRKDEQDRVTEQQQRKQRTKGTVHDQTHDQPSSLASGKKRPRSPRSPFPSTSNSSRDGHSAPSHDDDTDNNTFRGNQHGTVGAIACDSRGRVCAGVSSGGIWMKTAGRIGSAALIGCGCHAENGDDDGKDPQNGKSADGISVACSISGCGEDIIEELMAVRCCDALKAAKLSPPPRPSNTISENNASVTLDIEHSSGSGNSGSGSGDRSEKRTELERVMKQLIEKEAIRQATFTANDKKRTKNAQGSNNTQQQDDGLSSGIIACRVLKKSRQQQSPGGGDGVEERMDDGGSHADGHPEPQSDEELTLDFCYAHTAPHFAVGYAVNDRLNGYQNKGWISQQSDEQTQRRIMKLGYLSIAITPIHNQQRRDEDGEDNRKHGSSGGSSDRAERGRQRQKQQRREEDDEDGHVARSADTTRPNGRQRERNRGWEEDDGDNDHTDERTAEHAQHEHRNHTH